MHYAYVAQSIPIPEYLYKGHCSDLSKRLKEHNRGLTKSLRGKLPVRIVYFEVFETLEQAIAREKYFKSAAGRRYLKKVLKHTGVRSGGDRTEVS